MEQKSNYSELEVVNYLQLFITTEDFKLAQAQFFFKNCKHFEEDDENKHIYLDLFKEYVKILDQVIETQILQKFPDLDLEIFFENFEQKFTAHYQDSDLIENIKSFLDFSLFKKMMLKAKQGLINTDDKIGAYEGLDLDYSKFLSLYNEDYQKQWSKCMQSSKEITLEVFTRKEKISGMDVMRVNGIFKGVNYKTVGWMSANLDSPYFQNNKTFKEIKLIEQTPKFMIVYFKCGMPIMSDRDFAVKITKQEKENEIIVVMNSIKHEKIPEIKGVVRAEMFDGFVTRPSKNNSNDAEVIEIGYWNFKGYMPKMLLNMFMSKIVSEEYKNLWKLCLEQQKKGQKK